MTIHLLLRYFLIFIYERVETMLANGSGSILVCGLNNGTLSLRELWSLNEVMKFDSLQPHGPIKSLWFTDGMRTIIFDVSTSY